MNTDRALDIHMYQEANHSWENNYLARYEVKFSLWIISWDVLRSNACLMSSFGDVTFNTDQL